MRDKKNIITIQGLKFAVQRTFSNEPGVYIKVKPDQLWVDENDNFVHISNLNYKGEFHTDIGSICLGMEPDDEVLIFAHRKEDIGKELFSLLSDEKIIIDGKEYYIDLNSNNKPAIYIATKICNDVALYHLSEYINYARQVISSKKLLYEIGRGFNQVVILANMIDKPKLKDVHLLINGVDTLCGIDKNARPCQTTRSIEDVTCEECNFEISNREAGNCDYSIRLDSGLYSCNCLKPGFSPPTWCEDPGSCNGYDDVKHQRHLKKAKEILEAKTLIVLGKE